MFARLRSNFGLKMLAFFMAVVTAVLVKTLAKPISELPAQRVYTKPIDILTPNNNDLISSINPKEVTVTISGTKNVIDRIDPKLISVVVDLSKRTKPGTSLEAVDAMAPGGAEISQVEPSHVWAAVSERTFASVPVKIGLIGKASDSCRLENPIVEPSKVRIVGSMEDVDKVAFVSVPISISGIKSSFSTRAVTLTAVDVNGKKVDNVEIYTNSVFVTIPAYPVRKVQVSLNNIQVESSSGEVYQVNVIPEEVYLSGDDIENASLDSLEVEKCVLKYAGKSVSRKVKLLIPSKYRAYGVPQNQVTVTVEPLAVQEATDGKS
ncbi:MAG: YbbR-like domain-containing protein [Candidatus Bruticola sp.]